MPVLKSGSSQDQGGAKCSGTLQVFKLQPWQKFPDLLGHNLFQRAKFTRGSSTSPFQFRSHPAPHSHLEGQAVISVLPIVKLLIFLYCKIGYFSDRGCPRRRRGHVFPRDHFAIRTSPC
ncbi:hypothetical protein BDR03DRAFT_952562 [Suillus americanus]|nr:hypothetical protein BDR03DRAFT_952562 [Suillus americanus]